MPRIKPYFITAGLLIWGGICGFAGKYISDLQNRTTIAEHETTIAKQEAEIGQQKNTITQMKGIITERDEQIQGDLERIAVLKDSVSNLGEKLVATKAKPRIEEVVIDPDQAYLNGKILLKKYTQLKGWSNPTNERMVRLYKQGDMSGKVYEKICRELRISKSEEEKIIDFIFGGGEAP